MFLFGPSAIKTNFWPLIRSSPLFLGKLFIAQVVSQMMNLFIDIFPLQTLPILSLYIFYPTFPFLLGKKGWELKHQRPASTRLSYKSVRLWGALHALEGSDMENLELCLHRQAAEVTISSLFTVCLRAHRMRSHTSSCEHLLKAIHAAAARHPVRRQAATSCSWGAVVS